MTRPPVPEHILSLKPYPPGKPLKELERELGVSGAIKLASNENPFGPSPKAVAAIAAELAGLNRYPDGSAYYLRHRLAERLGQPPERLVFGCGSNEIIDLTGRTFVGPGGRAVVPHPSFLVYRKFLQAIGAQVTAVPLAGLRLDLPALARAVDEATRLVILCNPNNPTGTAVKLREIEAFAADLPPATILLLDEAYQDFVRDPEAGSGLGLVADGRNIIVLRTFSKVYGLAGLRLGYGIMNAELADFLNRVRQPFNVTSPALAGAEAALEDEDWLAQVKARTWAGMDFLFLELSGLGLEPVPSQTNFILFKVPGRAEEVYHKLLHRGVIIRPMTAFGLDHYLRVSVGTEAENERFIQELQDILGNDRG